MFTNIKDNTLTAKTIVVFLLCTAFAPCQLQAQEMPELFSDRFLMHFELSSDKLIQLAEAMPEETYDWTPDGDAMTVARVFMHIARYNYILPSNSPDIHAPENIDLDTLEEIGDKETVIIELQRSIEFVREQLQGLTPDDLQQPAEIFGQQTQRWAVLFMMMTHMSEHLGQAVSYARMNGVVPPWSN